MDWNGFVAVGTMLLAIATFMSVYQGRKQMQVISKQLNLQKGQQIPHMFIKNVVFEGDTVKFDVENATDVAAYWTGLETSFFLVRLQYYDGPDNGHEINWGQAIKMKEEGKVPYGKYYWLGSDASKLTYEGKEVKPGSAVSFFDPQGVRDFLPAKSNVQISTTPRFLITWREKGDQFPSTVGFEYSLLREFLLKNNITEVAVSMSLICKDSAETTVDQGYVTSFIINTSSDKCLADSAKHVRRFDFLPISRFDRLSNRFWIPEEEYHNTYSNWHIFE